VSLNSLGEVARHQGNRRRALILFQESLAVFRSEGIKLGMVQCLENMGRAAAESLAGVHPPVAAGEGPGGESCGSMAGEAAEGRVAESTATPASGLPGIAAAAKLFGAAEAVRDALGTPLPPVDQADHDRCLAAVRAALGEDAFAAARAAGHAMDLEQAVAHALEGVR
jgi:hypothetical protein